MSIRRSLLCVATITILWASSAVAATIQAASCSQTDVQSAINRAVTGDVVVIPAGNCTWTDTYTWKAPVFISSSTKISLQGAGMDATIIKRSPVGPALSLGLSGSRVTAIQFVDGWISADGDGWRVHNCQFYSEMFTEGVLVQGTREGNHPTGLIDHCIFHNTRVAVQGGPTMLSHGIWAKPLQLGTGENVVYVEDNVFTATVYANAIDANYGGRYVFRYNTVNDYWVEAHSVQGNTRATRSWEIYNNTFNQKNRSMWVPFRLRSGTGVIFNNTMTGTWTWPAIVLDNRRSCENLGDGGFCNGSSPWDGNQSGGNGYPCRDQIGRSTDQWLWTSINPYPPQALEPAYSWNNKYGSNSVNFGIYNGCANTFVHIKSGRDFYDNTPKAGYVPYTYPHPLTQSWGTDIPTPTATTTPTTNPTVSPTPATTTTTTPTTTTVTTAKMTKVYDDSGKLIRVIRLFNR